MLNYITPKMARLILAAIRPHLVAFIDVLDQWEQHEERDPQNCSEFTTQYDKPPSEVCADIGSTNVTAHGKAGQCFRCVFAHYGLSLDDSFTNIAEAEFLLVIERWRAILNGYLLADARLKDVILEMLESNSCTNLSLTDEDVKKAPSVLDRLLGDGSLLVSNEWDAQPNPIGLQTDPNNPETIIEPINSARTVGTSQIIIHDDQFVYAEDWNEIEYQSIEFVFVHELGHIFHNRINDVIGGEVSPQAQLNIGGDERTITLYNTPSVVRDYFEKVTFKVQNAF